MQHPMHHIHNPSGHDMNLTCTLLLTSNSIMGWLSNMSFIQYFQLLGILASIVASAYVAYNQHMNIQWKKRQNQNGGDVNRENHRHDKQ